LTAKRGSEISLPNGDTVKKAFRGISESSSSRLSRAIRLGVLEGESLPKITRRLKGPNLRFNGKPQNAIALNSALKNSEGMLLSNKQIQTVVRTTVNQVQNAASQAVYAANKDITGRYQYVATLDARTSSICQRLDGQLFRYDQGPVPPQHFNCRSTTVPVIDDDDLARAFPNTRPSATGRVPQDTNYANWLKDNPDLQDKVLGKKKRYFNYLMSPKRGTKQLNATNALKKIIREDGSELTLKELAAKYKDAN
jgi:SPP1 gp7 family putative phage head morphogenesis protein